ncbi:MAG TPA: hypothetical protein VGX21_19555, partial [Methylomirabilota bacterium]|nr:hypothetical protein [Methylomirabilota bacterium]
MKPGRVTAAVWLAVTTTLAGCKGAPPALPPAPAAKSLLLPPGATPALPPEQAVIDRVVAVVNEDVILISELQEAIALYLRDNQQSTPTPEQVTELERRLLQRMIDQR